MVIEVPVVGCYIIQLVESLWRTDDRELHSSNMTDEKAMWVSNGEVTICQISPIIINLTVMERNYVHMLQLIIVLNS